MAKLKKGSEAAKAWGRKMKALRTSKTKANINKPVFVKRSKVKPKMSKKNRKYRHKERPIHLVPDVMEIGGIAFPFFNTGGTGYSAAGSLANAIMGTGGVSRSQAMADAVDNFTGNLKDSVIPAGELIIGGLVVKWLGKKFGLNKVGTKEVKIL